MCLFLVCYSVHVSSCEAKHVATVFKIKKNKHISIVAKFVEAVGNADAS
jgi:hypothetical protein